MTMPKCKLAILAIAVLLQLHAGAGYLFAQNSRIALGPQDAKTEAITRQETRMFRNGAFAFYFNE